MDKIRRSLKSKGWKYTRGGFGDLNLDLYVDGSKIASAEFDEVPTKSGSYEFFLVLRFDKHFSSVFSFEILNTNLRSYLTLEPDKVVTFSGNVTEKKAIKILTFVADFVWNIFNEE